MKLVFLYSVLFSSICLCGCGGNTVNNTIISEKAYVSNGNQTVNNGTNTSEQSTPKPIVHEKKVNYSIEYPQYSLPKVVADFGNNKYDISIDDISNIYVIEDQADYTGNGYTDLLVSYAAGNSYESLALVVCQGPGYFSVLTEGFPGFPEIVSKGEVVNSNKTVVLDYLLNGTSYRSTYNFCNNKVNCIQTFVQGKLNCLLEITLDDLSKNTLDGKGSDVFYFDLDCDGIEDKIIVSYWERWDCLLLDKCIMSSNNSESHISYGSDYIRVLTTKTNGVYDISFSKNRVYVWNGVEYVEK